MTDYEVYNEEFESIYDIRNEVYHMLSNLKHKVLLENIIIEIDINNMSVSVIERECDVD